MFGTIIILYVFCFGILAVARSGYPHIKIIKFYNGWQTGYTRSDLVFTGGEIYYVQEDSQDPWRTCAWINTKWRIK